MSTIRRFARATLATLTLASIAFASSTASADIREPLTAENSAVLLVDLQPQYAFSVHSIDADKLVNNATGFSKAARVFGVPTRECNRPSRVRSERRYWWADCGRIVA
jgi:hypothetical protein